MSKRQRSVPEEKTDSEMEQEDVPETRRTRSGRKVRTPAALLDSEVPVRTPTRRTRRSVLQELPAVDEKNTEEAPQGLETLAEEKLIMTSDPEPCTVSEPPEPCSEPAAQSHSNDVNCSEDANLSGPAPAETAPAETAPAETAPAETALAETAPTQTTEPIPKKKPCPGPAGTRNSTVPLGKPKSGRVWKDRNKQRFSALVRDKQLCSSWEKKMEAKRDKQLVKQYTLQLKEEKARQKEEKRKRREENLKRRAENERKAEIVQVIKNTSKIKRMKKKQLRKIEKRDTLALLQKSQTQTGKAKGQKSKKFDKDQKTVG